MLEAIYESEADNTGIRYQSPCRGCKGNGACCGRRYEPTEKSPQLTHTITVEPKNEAYKPGAGYAVDVPWYRVDTEHVDSRHRERFVIEKARKLSEMENMRLKCLAQDRFRNKISHILSLQWLDGVLV